MRCALAAAALLAAGVLPAPPAAAQVDAPAAPHAGLSLQLPALLQVTAPEASAGAFARPSPDALRTLRLEHDHERRVEGWVLMGWALANVAAGAVIAGVGRDDPFWLSNGLMSAGWGLVNGLLAIPLIDPGGNRRRKIERGVFRDATEPSAIALEGYGAELKSGQVFALNLGLDVFYVATGVLLMLLGSEIDDEAVRGAGASVIGQGIFLFGFDVANWITSNRRADGYRSLLENGAPAD